MKSIQQIDKRLNQKMDGFDKTTSKDKAIEISRQTAILDYINALIWVLDAQDWFLLPENTRHRLERLGKD